MTKIIQIHFSDESGFFALDTNEDIWEQKAKFDTESGETFFRWKKINTPNFSKTNEEQEWKQV